MPGLRRSVEIGVSRSARPPPLPAQCSLARISGEAPTCSLKDLANRHITAEPQVRAMFVDKEAGRVLFLQRSKFVAMSCWPRTASSSIKWSLKWTLWPSIRSSKYQDLKSKLIRYREASRAHIRIR